MPLVHFILFHSAWTVAEYVAFQRVSGVSPLLGFLVGVEFLLSHVGSIVAPKLFSRRGTPQEWSISDDQAVTAAFGMVTLVVCCSSA